METSPTIPDSTINPTHQPNYQPDLELKKQNNLLKILVLIFGGLFLLVSGAFGYSFILSKTKLTDVSEQPKDNTSNITNIISTPTPTQTNTQTSNWKVYENKEVGFSFKYPATVVIGTDKNSEKYQLNVSTKNLDTYEDEPLGYDKETALKDIEFLTKGEYGMKIGMSFQPTEKVLKINNTNIKTFLTLQGLDVCTIMFSRTAIFYLNNYKVEIALSTPFQRITTESPQYFKKDSESCGNQLVWSHLFIFNSFIENLLSK